MSLGRPKRFDVGSMRHRCTIETPTETQDSFGQPVVTWSNFLVDEPCQFLPVGGSEPMRGRQIEEKAKAIFRIRYRSGYTQSMRILFDGDYYGILRIDKIDGLRRYLEVTTTT